MVPFSLEEKVFAVKTFYAFGESVEMVLTVLQEASCAFAYNSANYREISRIVQDFEKTGSILNEFYYTTDAEVPEEEVVETVVEEIIKVEDQDVDLLELPEVDSELELEDQEIIEECEIEDDSQIIWEEEEEKLIEPKKEVDHECSECHAKFRTKTLLGRHKTQAHRKEKILTMSTWTCDECGKVSTTRRTHRSHLLVHSDLKPYACTECPLKFARSQGLKRHLRTHTGEKPYVCEFCGAAFSAYMSHQMHVRLHTGERPYECKHCQEKFIGLPALNVHLKSHEGEYKFDCNYCSRRYKTEKTLQEHIEKKHTNGEYAVELQHDPPN